MRKYPFLLAVFEQEVDFEELSLEVGPAGRVRAPINGNVMAPGRLHPGADG
jgi:hypothetical protein